MSRRGAWDGTLPPETFRLTLAPLAGHYVVHVADTAPLLRLCMQLHSPQAAGLACVVEGRMAADPSFRGILYLSREHLTESVVAHELAHIAFRTLERQGRHLRHWRLYRRTRLGQLLEAACGWDCGWREWADPDEELFCEILGRLHAEFWRQAGRHGLAAARPAALGAGAEAERDDADPLDAARGRAAAGAGRA